jgi:Na+-transporting methylmalonyl-CoA/oxaloacetate decarboxylase gamma subunit
VALETILTVVVRGMGPAWRRALPKAATVPSALNSQKPRPLGLEAIPLTGPKPVGAGPAAVPRRR